MEIQLRLSTQRIISWLIKGVITGEEAVYLLRNRIRSILVRWKGSEYSFR